MFAHESNPVYTVYIQGAEIWQKNESLSKNKCSKIVQHSVANRILSYNLSDVSNDVRTSKNKCERVESRADINTKFL